MTDNRTTELREKLTERGVEHEARDSGMLHVTSWLARGVQWNYREIGDTHSLTMGNPWVGCTPEQAIAATLGGGKLTAEQLRDAINELQKKQPYCYDPDKPPDTLKTIGRYIGELESTVLRMYREHPIAQFEQWIEDLGLNEADAWKPRTATTDAGFARAVHDGNLWRRVNGHIRCRNCGLNIESVIALDGCNEHAIKHCPNCGHKVVG